jgi:hypothetical protein
MPRQWRHVIYITEDAAQVRRILSGIVGYSDLGINLELVKERLHIVEALRLDPAFVASVGKTYREQWTRKVDDVEVLPLVVFDTKSAVLASDNENDNSEASRMMSSLKQGFNGLPLWVISHVAKSNLSRSDVTGLSSRGASAIEGDANQTMFLIREGDIRYLIQGKLRFEPRWHELEITSYTSTVLEADEFGNKENLILRWGIANPSEITRKEAKEQAVEDKYKEDEATLRAAVRDAVEQAWQIGIPLNRAGVKAKIHRRAIDVADMIENLISEGWLYEITVPTKDRTNNKRSTFLINLSTTEHEAWLGGFGLPNAKMVIPESWKKF